MSLEFLSRLPQAYSSGEAVAITSVCSAHPLVIEAAIRHSKDNGGPLLIEATCNQVNHEGGYTGMTPVDFKAIVEEIAETVGHRPDLILGGDHLGPNPWKSLPAEEAMGKAKAMVAAYVAAGFSKIHLDASMACVDDAEPLVDAVIAKRAADLASVAEKVARDNGLPLPLYIIGTEVPVPGGAMEALDGLEVTPPAEALETVSLHEKAFAEKGISGAFGRVVGLVVQPGVEFSSDNVVVYDRSAARELSASLPRMQSLVFEAHSTDYQPVRALEALARDGFAIQKVGPWLTFALREALYGLDRIAQEMGLLPPEEGLQASMERLMLAEPKYWQAYYHGNERQLYLERHYSYSDRIRYYWPRPEAEDGVERLFAAIDGKTIPEPLASQFLPYLNAASLTDGPRQIVIASIRAVLDRYAQARFAKA